MEAPTFLENLWFRVRGWLDESAPLLMAVLMAVFAVTVFNLATAYNLPPTRDTLREVVIDTVVGAIVLFLLWSVLQHYRARIVSRAQADYDYDLRYHNRSRLISIFAEGLTVANGEHAAFRQGLDDYAKLLIKTNNSWPVDRVAMENGIHRSTVEDIRPNVPSEPTLRAGRKSRIEIVDAERPE